MLESLGVSEQVLGGCVEALKEAGCAKGIRVSNAAGYSNQNDVGVVPHRKHFVM